MTQNVLFLCIAVIPVRQSMFVSSTSFLVDLIRFLSHALYVRAQQLHYIYLLSNRCEIEERKREFSSTAKSWILPQPTGKYKSPTKTS